MALLDCSCWREASNNSASTLAVGLSGFSTTSCVNAANPMNSIRTTYLPRVIPERPNLPSELVAATYFFPVNVFAAVTVTPGNAVLPLCTDPVISDVRVEAGAGATCGAACGEDGGGVSCARECSGDRIAVKMKTKMPRVMNFKSKTPR